MAVKPPRTVSELEKRLELGHHLPRMAIFVAAVTVAAVILLFAWPSRPSQRLGWSAGPVTNHHRLAEAACESCHAGGFKGAPDEKCLGCHSVHEHASAVPAVVKQHPELGSRCTTCHREHHGEQNLVPTDSPLCTSCHGRMGELVPATAQPSVPSFLRHPEFAVEAWSGDPPKLGRVRLGQPGMRGASSLKFSHALHLDLEPKPGKAALGCASCHGTGDLAPVSYERHCQECHPIEFDDRLPSSRVPHGSAAGVFPFVRSEVARWHLERSSARAERIDSEARDDEAGLFTEGGGCMKCHLVSALPEAGAGQTRYQVEMRPKARWMPAAHFAHGTHTRAGCDHCHKGSASSRSSGDLLVPSIAVCRECHADPGTPGKVESPCIQCHDYHAKAAGSRSRP
jgi:hypothetical protein